MNKSTAAPGAAPGRASYHSLLFWATLALAAGLRLVFYSQIRDTFLFQTPILDAKYYHDWALEILRGDVLGRSRGVFMMSPGYSYLLAFVYWLFGVNVSAVALLQFASGVVSGVLVYLIAKRFFSREAALISMAIYLFYAPAMFFESTLLKPSLINLCNLSVLYLTVLGGPLNALLSGVFLGVSTQLRPNALLLLPLILYWLARSGRRAVASAAWCVAGLAAILLPVAARNYAVGKEFVMTTAHGGMNFYTGNSPYCLGPYTPLPFARTDPRYEQADFLNQARALSGKALTAAESSAFWMKESLRYIAGNPGAWTRLMFRKVLIFANDFEPQINLNYNFVKQQYGSALSWIPISFGVVLPAAVVGMVFGGWNVLLTGYLALYFISNALFFVVSEYRFPIVPVLCVYAGLGIAVLFRKLGESKFRDVAAIAALAALVAFVTNLDVYARVFGFDTYKKSNYANSYFVLGSAYEENGRVEEARRSYEKSVEIMPLTDPLLNLAGIYARQNDPDTALKLNEAALRVDPESAEAYANIGALLYGRGDYQGATRYFQQALRYRPDMPEARRYLETLGVGD